MRRLTWAMVCVCALMVLPVMGAQEGGAVKVDRSTPKGAIKALYQLAFSGKVDELASAYVTPSTPEEKEMLELGWSDDIYAPSLFKALVEKFPEETEKQPMPNFEKLLERVNKEVDGLVEEKVDESTVLLKPADPAARFGPFTKPIKVVKAGSEWKLAIASGALLRPVANKEVSQEMRKLWLGTIADIKAGKFASAREADKALTEQRMALIKKFPAATRPGVGTQPTSGPGR